MTIHITLDEAAKRLGELADAAARGEDVVLNATDGSRFQIKQISGRTLTDEEREKVRRKRRSAVGMFAKEMAGFDLSVEALKRDRRER